MITFLRRMRRSFIGSGSTRKYILYAIGEIALVVIGILIALQINNWNEERKTKNQVKDQLLVLVDALRDDISSFQRSLEINEFRYSSFLYLLKIGGNESTYEELESHSPSWIWEADYPESYNREFIDKSFSWFHRGYGNLVINRSAINEMNNSGIFSRIKNAELKSSINDYYNFINWRFGPRDMELRYRPNDELVRYIQDKYEVWTSDISDLENPMTMLREDQGMILRLRSVIRETSWHIASIKSSMELADKLIEEIESFMVS